MIGLRVQVKQKVVDKNREVVGVEGKISLLDSELPADIAYYIPQLRLGGSGNQPCQECGKRSFLYFLQVILEVFLRGVVNALVYKSSNELLEVVGKDSDLEIRLLV